MNLISNNGGSSASATAISFSHPFNEYVVQGDHCLDRGGAGASGAGLGAGIAKLGVGLAGRTALNALGSAAIGSGAQLANNILDKKCWNKDLGKAAMINGIMGGLGSLASDGLTGLSNSFQNFASNQAFNTASLTDRLMVVSNAISSTSTNGSGLTVGFFNTIGIAISNSGPLVAE